MCNEFFDEYREDLEVREMEVFCNAVAAAILMPQAAIRSLDTVRGRDPEALWTEPELRQAAAQFGVSAEAMLRRLLTLGLATKENYQALRRAWLLRPPPGELGLPRFAGQFDYPTALTFLAAFSNSAGLT